MQPHYHSLEEALDLIEGPNRSVCYKLLEDHREVFTRARGAKVKHQDWEGGYLDHITEIMNLAIALYDPLHSRRPLPFSLSDALLVLFLHDLEKPWRYVQKGDRLEDAPEFSDKDKIQAFVNDLIAQYDFQLTDDHRNALRYVEGEGKDYDQYTRLQGPLAAFVHTCDTISARIWYDCPMEEDDPWEGSCRSLPQPDSPESPKPE